SIICTWMLCIIAGLFFYSCNKSSGSNNSSTNTGGTTTANTVVIKGFAFSPSSLTVKKGTKVTWVNNDGPAHTVTATDNGNTFNSGTINPGGSYSFTFTTTGDFNYNCSIHPQMLGSVHVE
ncbi:MAG TPA: cupredoxin family copper-binding protein, partial [Hanamia sp.]|nr:cupredoxin family copper-binding protein [Hanamia sp.]